MRLKASVHEKKVMLQKLPALLAAVFFIFLLWILFMANTEQDIFIFRFVRSLPYGDKMAHIFVFGVLTLLLNLASKNRALSYRRVQIQWGTLFVTVFATAEETSQHFIPNRTPDLFDYACSLMGILLFTLLSKWKRAAPG